MNRKKLMQCLICILLAVLSATVVCEKTESSSLHQNTISYLDEKKDTAMALTASSAIASVAIAAVPGDSTTPIANKIVDVSENLVIVTCALYLEKYLATVLGKISFRFVFPIVMLLLLGYVLSGYRLLHKAAVRLGIFALAMTAVIPVSVAISKSIDNTFGNTIQETIDSAQNTPSESDEQSEKKGILGTISDYVTKSSSEVITYCKNMLENFVNSIAVMIVTTCLIPVGVILLFLYLIRLFLGMNPEYTFRNLKQR